MADPKQLARDILSLAVDAGMPESYWQTDKRIARAAKTLNTTVEAARAAAYAGKLEELG